MRWGSLILVLALVGLAGPARAQDPPIEPIPEELLGDFGFIGDGVIEFFVQGDEIFGRVTTRPFSTGITLVGGRRVGNCGFEDGFEVPFALDRFGVGEWFWFDIDDDGDCARFGGAPVSVQFTVGGATANGQRPAGHPDFDGITQAHAMVRIGPIPDFSPRTRPPAQAPPVDDGTSADAAAVGTETGRGTLAETEVDGSPGNGGGFPVLPAVGAGIAAIIAAAVAAAVKKNGREEPEPEDITPTFGEPRRANTTVDATPQPSVDPLAALQATHDEMNLVDFGDGIAAIDRRLIDAQLQLASATDDFRLGFLKASAALAPSDSVIRSRGHAIATAEVADFIVGMVQLGLLSVQGAKAIAKLYAGSDEIAEAVTTVAGAATKTEHASGTVFGAVDEVADATEDLTHTFAHTDDYAHLNDSLDPGTWDPAIVDDLPRLLGLSEDALKRENVALARSWWGEYVDPVALADLAKRAGVRLDEFRAGYLRGRSSVPDHEIVEGLMLKVWQNEGWMVPTMVQRFALQTLAARTRLLTDHGLKLTLRADELKVLQRIASDSDFASKLERIALNKVQTAERDLEPMLTAIEAQNLRDLAATLARKATGATPFAFVRGETAAEIIITATGTPVIPVAATELASALIATRQGERIIISIGPDAARLPGARFVTAAGEVVDTPTPFGADGLHYVAVVGDAILDAGPLASLLDQLGGLDPDAGPTLVQMALTPTVTLSPATPTPVPLEMLTIGGPFDLDAKDLRVLSDALTAAVHAATNGTIPPEALIHDLRYLIGDHPGLLEQLTEISIQAGPVVAHPFTADAATWLDKFAVSLGDPHALRSAIGPVRLARALHAVDIRGDVDMNSMLNTGVEAAIDSIPGGFDRPFILLGLEVEPGVMATIGNVGMGALTAPIETGQRAIFGFKLYGTVTDMFDDPALDLGDMRVAVESAEDALRDLARVASSGALEDLERDLLDYQNQIVKYEEIRATATGEALTRIDSALAELRAITGPAAASIEVARSLENLPELADALGARLADPITGEARPYATIEVPTLVHMAHAWNTVRNTMAEGGLPLTGAGPTPAPTTVQLEIDDGALGEATMSTAIEVVTLS
jgi:hypothetical protein